MTKAESSTMLVPSQDVADIVGSRVTFLCSSCSLEALRTGGWIVIAFALTHLARPCNRWSDFSAVKSVPFVAVRS